MDSEAVKSLPSLFRWLTLAALADWLITRTLTRSAIFVPKSPPVITAYEALGLIGQWAFTLTSLLALVAVGWMAFRLLRARRGIVLPITLLGLLALSLLFVVIPPGGWLAVDYHLLVIAAAGLIGWGMWTRAGGGGRKIAWVFPALALLAGEALQLNQALFGAMRWPGPPPGAMTLFNLGELFAVLSMVGLWWAYCWYPGQDGIRPYVLAALPALAFSAAHLINPAMTGIVAIWSTGLTLYLPWPVYAVSLWLAGVVVFASLRRGDAVGWAVLLLAAGGYAPQLSTQVFLILIALWLLSEEEGAPGLGYDIAVWAIGNRASSL